MPVTTKFRTDLIGEEQNIRFAAFRSLWRLWAGRMKAGQLPARADFAIEEFLDWSRYIGMFEVDPETGKLRVKLACKAMIELNNKEITGAFLEDICHPEVLEDVLEPYRTAAVRRVATQQQIVISGEVTPADLELLVLPMSTNGQDVDYYATALHYTGRPQTPFDRTPLQVGLVNPG
tara:strand:+ start:264 stop:794 length:531 start_codon:yes stop_codon:yes gene_type:complete